MTVQHGIRGKAWGNVTFLVASLFFVVFASGAVPVSEDDDPARWDTSHWVEWRDEQIHRILAVTVGPGEEKILSRNEVVLRSADAYKTLAPLLATSDFLSEPARRKELGNFISFVRAQSNMALIEPSGTYSHALGYGVSDKEYWTAHARELKFPALLKSDEFLRDLSHPSTYKKAVDMVVAQNAVLPDDRKWIVIIYRSRFLKSTDKLTYGRLLVVVPNDPIPDGSAVDRWIQFSVETPEMSSPASLLQSVSMVAIHRASGKNQAFLADFMRDRDRITGKFTIVPTMFEQKNPSKNCYECHKSPVLPIQPKSRYKFDIEGRLVEEELTTDTAVDDLNSRIPTYGKCEIASMDMEAYGPSIGPLGLDRTNQFVRGAARDSHLSDETCDRVRSAMKCASCHNDFSKLNYPQAVNSTVSFLSFEQKIGLPQTFVESGWMPPKNNLSGAERKVLWKCLQKEYYDPDSQSGVLIDWLQGGH